jgi:hypothetical protein
MKLIANKGVLQLERLYCMWDVRAANKAMKRMQAK